MTETPLEGGCLCGAVRFTVAHVEAEFHACHCGMCRRWAGGPYFAAFADGVLFTGASEPARYASSTWAERGFCATCGTTLFYYLRAGDRYAMSIGAFDDVSAFRLTREIFIDKKPSGYAMAGEHARWTEAETFARLAPSEQE